MTDFQSITHSLDHPRERAREANSPKLNVRMPQFDLLRGSSREYLSLDCTLPAATILTLETHLPQNLHELQGTIRSFLEGPTLLPKGVETR